MMKIIVLTGLLAFAIAGEHGDVEYEREIKRKIGKATDVEMDEYRQILRSGAAADGVELILNESNKELKKDILDLPERGMEHLIKAIDMANRKNKSDLDEDITDDEAEDRTNEIVSRCDVVEWLNETNEPCGMDDEENKLDD